MSAALKAAFALHLISHPETLPGQVFEVDEKEFDRLASKGAVREPTEEELALYELSKKSAAPAATAATTDDDEAKVATGKAEKAEREALVQRLKDAGQKPHPKTGLPKLREAVAALDAGEGEGEGDGEGDDLDLGGDD